MRKAAKMKWRCWVITRWLTFGVFIRHYKHIKDGYGVISFEFHFLFWSFQIFGRNFESYEDQCDSYMNKVDNP